MKDGPVREQGLETRLLRSGRIGVTVNPPIHRASTILFDTVAALETAKARRFDRGNLFYGRFGTPDVFAVEEGVSVLEGGVASLAVPSGLAACVLPAIAFLKPGDHMLVVDTAYEPARASFSSLVARNGVHVEYYDPRAGAGIAALLRPETRMVYLESPGSLTFEVQDIPAITAAVAGRGILTVCDNTWATGVNLRPLDLGVDLVVQAGTKYIVGHSDAMLGFVSMAHETLLRPLREAANWLGYNVSPDDVFLAGRGLRTLAVRLRRHHETGLALARWLEGRPGIYQVIHPALASHPDHAIWARDFRGASGLFSVLLDTRDKAVATRFVESLELFGMGFSWGGFESLVLLADPAHARTATRWDAPRIMCRVHAGLEEPADLIADLEQAMAAAGLG